MKTTPHVTYRALPSSMQRHAKALLDLQMWCWGCDVRRSEGNLLLTYGAIKRPAPDPRYHSAYTWMLAPDTTLTLWGWGVWIAQITQGSLFFSRSGFNVLYTPQPELTPAYWRIDDLPALKTPHDKTTRQHAHHLLHQALVWIAGYEAWVHSQVSPQYRENVMQLWPQAKRHKAKLDVAHLNTEWLNLTKIITA